jgi:hypothetical protein
MGSDVHFFLERKVNNQPWEIDPGHRYVEERNGNKYPLGIPTLSGRNYYFFGLIAGVRTSHKKFIRPKGLPLDVSPVVQETFNLGGWHTPSWISIKELEWAISKLEYADYWEDRQNEYDGGHEKTKSRRHGDADSAFKDELCVIDKSIIRYVERFQQWEKAENLLLGTKNRTRFRLVFWFDS